MRKSDPEKVHDRPVSFGRRAKRDTEPVPEAAMAAHAQHVPDGVRRVHAPAPGPAGRGKGIKVAVIDCGIDATHPDLAANCKGNVNFLEDDDGTVKRSHGTQCAGIIAAVDNGLGIVGVAPEAELYSVKVMNLTGDLKRPAAAIISGLEWCMAHGINVINMSLELGEPATAQQQKDQATLEKTLAEVERAGILIVASSGDIDEPPDNESTAQLPVPARFDSVIAVGAINEHNKVLDDSARGPKVELCAQATNVLSTLKGGTYAICDASTSTAAPHVAGAAAAVWSAKPKATNRQIRKILQETADRLGTHGRNPRYGFGCVNVERAIAEILK